MRTGHFSQSKVFTAAYVLPLLVAISACQPFDNLDKVADKTDQVAATSEHLSDQTAHVSLSTDQLLVLTQKLEAMTESMNSNVSLTEWSAWGTYKDLRQRDALQARKESLDSLKSEPVMENKLAEAGFYNMAFEFQLWKDAGFDDEQNRQYLFRDAVNELFYRTAAWVQDPNSLVDPTSSDNDVRQFLAVAATLHKVNANAEQLAKLKNIPEVSVRDLIESALKKSSGVETGKIAQSDLTQSDVEILKAKRQAIQLLEARVNFLPAMLLSKITSVTQQGWIVQAWMTFVGTKASFDGLDVETIVGREGTLKWITEANREYDFLLSIGYTPRIDSNLKRFYENMELPVAGKGSSDLQLKVEDRGARIDSENKILEQIHDFLNRISKS